jgi:hypothetical protein
MVSIYRDRLKAIPIKFLRATSFLRGKKQRKSASKETVLIRGKNSRRFEHLYFGF